MVSFLYPGNKVCYWRDPSPVPRSSSFTCITSQRSIVCSSFEVLLCHSEVNGISYCRIIALIAFFFSFLVKVWDLSFESYWSGASCKVTMIGHMHTVRCLQVKRQFRVYISFSKKKNSSSLGIFLAAKGSIDNLILNLVTSYKSVQSFAKSN